MAIKCRLVKVAKGFKAAPMTKAKMGDPAPNEFVIQVSEGGVPGTSNVTIFGTNDVGPVDISAVATLAVVSGDPAIATVDTPVGMNFNETAVAVGTVAVTCTATWNDPAAAPPGSPFSVNDNLSITAPTPPPPGPVTGLIVVHNPPTPA